MSLPAEMPSDLPVPAEVAQAYLKMGLPADATPSERRAVVAFMRLGGATFRQIANSFKLAETTIRSDYNKALREIASESRDTMIAEQRMAILELRRANFQKAISGDYDAQASIYRGMEREAKLFALDAPARTEGVPNQHDFAERMALLFAEMNVAAPRELTAMLPRGQAVIEGEIVPEPDRCDSPAAEPERRAAPAETAEAAPPKPRNPFRSEAPRQEAADKENAAPAPAAPPSRVVPRAKWSNL